MKGRVGRYNCVELPERYQALLGFLPLEDLGLEPDLVNQEGLYRSMAKKVMCCCKFAEFEKPGLGIRIPQ